jgi:hypothetical protein
MRSSPSINNPATRTMDEPMPYVGIFWFVPVDGVSSTIVFDRTTLAAAEPYGDFLTHPTGHFEFWAGLRRRGSAALAADGLPDTPCRHEYEDYPRGRIVYDSDGDLFVVYADLRLHHHVFVDLIIEAFSLHAVRVQVRSDAHYSRSLAVGRPKPWSATGR